MQRALLTLLFIVAAALSANVWGQAGGTALADEADNTTEPGFIQRNVLLEIFSTERCTNCPAGHQTIEYALGTAPHLIMMTHHAGFFTDKFTIPESVEYEWFYKSPEYSTSFAPAFMTDRTAWTSLPDYYYYGTPVSMSMGSKALKAAYNEAVKVPAYATITLLPTFDTEERTLGIDVEATALVATEGYEHPRLNVFLIEDEVFSKTQENSFGSYYHQHLVRQCLTTTWGEAFEAGGSISRHYSVTLPDDWDATKMSIVAYVANYNARKNSDCRVMNAEEARVIDQVVGINDVLADGDDNRHGDNGNRHDDHGQDAPLYSISGQRVAPSHLPHGIYISPNSKTTKLIVK